MPAASSAARHALAYRSIRHPRRGSPIDITDPASPQRAEQRLRDAGTYGPTTRRAPGGLLVLPLSLVDSTYGVAMLRAIARRAENPELAGT